MLARCARTLAATVAIAVLTLPVTALGARHAFNVNDLVTMKRVSGPRVSPDGRQVVFVVRTTDLEANRGRTALWLAGVDGSRPRPLTAGAASASSPRWAPDGKSVYFLSARGERTQVWRIAVDGGEAQPVTDLPLEVDELAVAPDGARLVVSVGVFPDCADLACTRKRLDAPAGHKASGQIFTRLFVRHWDRWEDGRRSHLVAVPLAGGPPVDLMRGMDASWPDYPFGDTTLAFTPDRKSVVFAVKDVGREEAWSTNFDLFVAPLDGRTRPRNLTAANKALDDTPAFSPDGKWLAYLSMSRPGYESDRRRVMVRAWPRGTAREVAPAWDRSPGDLTWAPDGRTLYATAENLGQRSLFAIDVAGGRAREVVKDGWVRTPEIAAGGLLLFPREDLRHPTELYTARPDGSELTRITHVTDDALAQIAFGEPEQFSFQGAGGDTVWGYVVKPANMRRGRKYPVAFLIHGGPQGSFGNDFHYRWNPQVYAGHGYAAVMIDFHGSTGYGQKFTDAINGDWGGKPLEDLKKGLDAALARYRFLDGKRVCALGASYGGYMINWIAGAWPDRFRCLVSHDGNLDEHAAYFDTEELWFPEWEHGGPPWDNPEGYQKHNPVNLVKNWKTPILVVHGARDYRVVATQGLATFNAAQRRGVPSQLLFFPDENHWVLKPANSIQWHDTVLAWLDRWTRK